ncbi:MAG TPA: sigma-70 family RNA polymerase sigma factor [Streptosporangiaceae bacterium]
MSGLDWLAKRFEEHRAHLRSVAYGMLGSLEDANDAVQEAWLRLSRSDTSHVVNLRGWLTTVTGRVCLDMLRSRASRHEQPLDSHLPDLIVSPAGHADPEQEALLAESVGLALHVVLETLPPAQRLAFVLHDMFGVPLDEIAAVLGRSTQATKQLARRARARIRADGPPADADPVRQHEAVQAFFEAARRGDFDGLVALLAPDVVMRSDGGVAARPTVTRGATTVASQVLAFVRPEATIHPAQVNGAAGVVVTAAGRPVSVIGFTVREGTVVAIDGVADPARLGRLDLSGFTRTRCYRG